MYMCVYRTEMCSFYKSNRNYAVIMLFVILMVNVEFLNGFSLSKEFLLDILGVQTVKGFVLRKHLLESLAQTAKLFYRSYKIKTNIKNLHI